MSSLVATALVRLAEEGEKSVSMGLSYGIGAIALGILVGLMAALLTFGRGRDHT